MAEDPRTESIQKELGYHPAFIGAAALAGGEAIERFHPVSVVAQIIATATMKGKEISEALYGHRLDMSPVSGRLAGFSMKDQVALARFKARQLGLKESIRTPLLAGPESLALPVDIPEVKFRDKQIVPRLKRFAMVDRASVPVAMHEIGHLTPILGGRAPALNTAWHASIPLARLLKYPVMAQVLLPPDEESSALRRFGYEHAPELVGATYLPMVLEEMRASGHALRGARRYGPGALAAAKELGPALGTYLASGLLPPILATILAKALVKHLYRKDEAEPMKKTAAPLRAMARAFMMKRAVMKPQGAMKNSLAVAYSNTPPNPQTTPVGGVRKIKADATGVKGTPPSKTRFFNDQSKATIGQGSNRLGVPSTGQ